MKLDELGCLLKLEWITHAYPHDWRTKKPIIFQMCIRDRDDTVIREFEKNENRRELLKAMEGLKERERMIVQMRYGIDHEELTQKDIAKKLGISQSYISRLEKRILQKLKVVMKANS